jgi:hypothetical protein
LTRRGVMGVMPRRTVSIGIVSIGTVLGVLALASAAPSAAQEAPRPRLTVVINPRPGDLASAASDQPELRPSFGLATRTSTLVTPAPLTADLPPPTPSAPRLKGETPRPKALNPSSRSALAAQCRAQCAAARYICTAREAGDCDAFWGECVVRCSGANYRDTSDLAVSSAYDQRP